MSVAIVFQPSEESVIVALANVMAFPAMLYPDPRNKIECTVRPAMSFVSVITGAPTGKVRSAAASPAGEPPIQFAGFENAPFAAPVQMWDAAKSVDEKSDETARRARTRCF